MDKITTLASTSSTPNNQTQNDLANILSMSTEELKKHQQNHMESNFPLFDLGIFMDSIHNIDFTMPSYKEILKEKLMKWFRIGKKFSTKKAI